VLVIDEAHQLSPSVLEEIRLFTNFETTQQKLVQVVLVGQPELDSKLDSFGLRQLKQRIAIRCRLEPLPKSETYEYVERRLVLAGATPHDARALFPLDTMEAVYRYSLGIPRLINSICDQALVAAYGRRLRVIPVELIDDIASYLRLQPTSPSCMEPVSPRLAEHKAAAQSLLQMIEAMEQTATSLLRDDL
jgi:general secretion pathway protein A